MFKKRFTFSVHIIVEINIPDDYLHWEGGGGLNFLLISCLNNMKAKKKLLLKNTSSSIPKNVILKIDILPQKYNRSCVSQHIK